MAFHNLTGKIGEDLGAIWFEEKGYTILHKNWRHKNLEVDVEYERAQAAGNTLL